MSKFAFQNATGLPAGGVEQFNATMLELAEGQGYEPKWQIVLASHSVCRVDGDPKLWNVHPKLWAAGQNLDVPRELCRGLESAVPIRTRMSFEYHPHSWAVVKYVLTKQLEMVAAHLDRKQDTISDSKEVLTADNSGAPASVGTEYFLAAAGGVALGPHEGQLTATDNKNPRFRITGLNLRRHTGRDTNAELYLFAPAQLAVWEKVCCYIVLLQNSVLGDSESYRHCRAVTITTSALMLRKLIESHLVEPFESTCVHNVLTHGSCCATEFA